MTLLRKSIATGDLVKISVDGEHFEVGFAVEPEPDQVGFWHVFSRGQMHLIAEWNIIPLTQCKDCDEKI